MNTRGLLASLPPPPAPPASEWLVKSIKQTWHEPMPATSYRHAIAVARVRGFDVLILCKNELVATWSQDGGVTIVNKRLAVEA